MLLTQLRYLAAFSLLPLMVLQGRRVRRQTPMLPEAGGPTAGQTSGSGAPLRLLVLGESTAAGCGVSSHADAMAGQLAAALTTQLGRPVAWRVVGRNGVTAKVTRQSLLPLVPLEPVDLAVIVLGVNDTKNLTPARRWRSDLQQLFFDLRLRVGPAQLLVSAVPPMEMFPALPAPLRQFLGLRAALMDAALRQAIAQTEQAAYGGPLLGLTPAMFSTDRFHPGASGYARWAAGLAEHAVELLTAAGSSTPAPSRPR